VTDVHRQAETTLFDFADLLRGVPDAGADVWRHAGIEFNLYALGGSGVYSERIGEHILTDRLLGRRERLLLERGRGDAVDGERAHVLVVGHVGEQVEAALGEGEAIRMNHVILHARARHRVVPHRRDAEVKRGFKEASHDVGR
jgi:hypothetical protein